MKFFLVDDDEVIRSLLRHIIEDEDLGEVVGEADNGESVTSQVLNFKNVDIVIIDLLMPARDGIETIRSWNREFKGKTIMLSQVESKELIGEAYTLGIEYYVTKPINKTEFLTIAKKVSQIISLEKTVETIRRSLNGVFEKSIGERGIESSSKQYSIIEAGEFLLSELGIIGENGSKDLIDIIQYLYNHEAKDTFEMNFPSMKEIFEGISKYRVGETASPIEILRETKASEQRVRRAINQSITHLASIGLTDFTNPKFENYALKFFDFSIVRNKMTELKNEKSNHHKQVKIHTKKFIQVLYFEAKKLVYTNRHDQE
ncbi:response regulator [Niallia sp. NCCP-28]|uniref:response regulator n=1 Tax=Niallia sp. NCCP-28 TaxID=2934712 RepID=UPI00208B9342|nr:response regulator [Niallia sp. NCCP-28]GKU82770.1 transcriptional regulator [Niallia sp. NCCP-28]